MCVSASCMFSNRAHRVWSEHKGSEKKHEVKQSALWCITLLSSNKDYMYVIYNDKNHSLFYILWLIIPFTDQLLKIMGYTSWYGHQISQSSLDKRFQWSKILYKINMLPAWYCFFIFKISHCRFHQSSI